MLRNSIGRTAAAAVVVVGGITAGSAPAAAEVGGSITITAVCNADGSPSGLATLHEDFTGLNAASPHPSYHVSATRTTDAGGILGDESWYPDPDGTHQKDYLERFGVTTDDQAVRAGEPFDWALYQTYGVITTVASGTVAVGGPTCVKYEKPKQAVLTNSPDKSLVNAHRHFGYSFRATPKVHGTIRVTRRGDLIASLDFVVPHSGKEAAVLTLHRDAYRALKQHGRLGTEVTVKLTRHGLSSRARKDLVLKPA